MLNLLIDGAVPFGYTAEVNDSDFIYADEYISVAAMNWQNLQNTQRHVPLPDVILSNTPPPSPLRRAHSYLTLFPEKPCDQPTSSTLLQPDLDVPNSSPEGEKSVPTRTAGVGEFMDEEEKVRTGLEHIEEVRRRLRSSPIQPHLYLPKLSWPLPQLNHSLQNIGEGKSNDEDKRDQREREIKKGESKNNEEKRSVHGPMDKGQEQRRWQIVGGDLRKIADQFQLDNSKAAMKNESKERLSLAVPSASTRYLTAFILSLIRLVTTLQHAPLISDVTVTRISFCTSLVSMWAFVSVFRNLAS